jgi:hypothetical protein
MICAADAMCKFPSGEKQNAGGAWQLDRRFVNSFDSSIPRLVKSFGKKTRFGAGLRVVIACLRRVENGRLRPSCALLAELTPAWEMLATVANVRIGGKSGYLFRAEANSCTFFR